MLLSLSFAGTLSSLVGDQLVSDLNVVIESSDAGISRAINSIEKLNPSKVIALGMYSGRDDSRCRLELSCSNKFRNDGGSKKLPINSWLNQATLKPAHGIGNSWCNKLSYEITSNYSSLPFSFVHIPKTYALQAAVDEIQYAISNLRRG